MLCRPGVQRRLVVEDGSWARFWRISRNLTSNRRKKGNSMWSNSIWKSMEMVRNMILSGQIDLVVDGRNFKRRE